MNKAIIGWVIAGIVIVGGIWYFATRDAAPAGENNEVSNGEGQTTTLADLMARDGDWECTFVQDLSAQEPPSRATGNFKITDGKIRGDFTTELINTENKLDTHMIQSDGTIYIWSSVAPQGIKLAAPANREAINADPARYSAFTLALNYDCKPWTVDASLFTPPADITFTTTQ